MRKMSLHCPGACGGKAQDADTDRRHGVPRSELGLCVLLEREYYYCAALVVDRGCADESECSVKRR